MPRFFYVPTKQFVTRGSLATFKRASPSITGEDVSTLQNTVRGISKSPSPSSLNEKRTLSRNISRAALDANSHVVIFDSLVESGALGRWGCLISSPSGTTRACYRWH